MDSFGMYDCFNWTIFFLDFSSNDFISEKKDNCNAKLKKCLSLNLGLANFHCIHTGKLAC